MAKIVLAGRSDCPYFARCELLGDRLVKNLKKFQLHKIVIQPDKWEKWLAVTCTERGWSFKKSPIVWRELIDRGGKGVLIGGANDFQEYAKAYYDVESEMNTFDMLTVCYENKTSKDISDREENDYKALSNPIKICITNAVSPICYYLIGSITSGEVFGPGVELAIRLLVSSPADIEYVRGTAMEAEDLASGLLRDVKISTSPHEAFKDCSFVIILDILNKSHSELQKDWLNRNHEFFSKYATIISHKALRTCKVLLCGTGPLNFNAAVIAQNAPRLSHKNILAVSTVVETYAKSVIGDKLNINPAGVSNLVVWGNINGKRYFDVSNCRVHGYGGAVKGPYWHSVNTVEMIHDNRWIEKDLPKLVTARCHKSFESQGFLTGLSTANCISNIIQNLCRGSPQNQIFSLGVCSEGWYSVPIGMFFSFPVTMDPKGCWNVVQDIEISKEMRDAIDLAIQDINLQIILATSGAKHAETNTNITMVDSSMWSKILKDDDTGSFWSHSTIAALPENAQGDEDVSRILSQQLSTADFTRSESQDGLIARDVSESQDGLKARDVSESQDGLKARDVSESQDVAGLKDGSDDEDNTARETDSSMPQDSETTRQDGDKTMLDTDNRALDDDNISLDNVGQRPESEMPVFDDNLLLKDDNVTLRNDDKLPDEDNDALLTDKQSREGDDDKAT